MDSAQGLAEPKPDGRKRIVLIGNTGVGKSTLGNALLGLETDCDSHHGFTMSSGVKSCTTRASNLDGYWMGDPTKPIRVIDTPGHGDSQGRDVELRQSIVDFLKEERFVHVFVWLKNSQAPKFDKQDQEFYKIFTEMFGGGFMDHLVVVLTRFSFSDSAEWSRKKSKTTLEGIVKGMRAKLMDLDEEIPIYPIDALHNPGNQIEVAKYQEYMHKLWGSILKFGEQPVQNIKVVEDDLAKLQNNVTSLTQQLHESSTVYAQHLEKMEEEQEYMRKVHESEKHALQGKLEDLLSGQKQMQEQQAMSEQSMREYLAEKEKLEAEMRKLEDSQQKAFQEQQERFRQEQIARQQEKAEMERLMEQNRAEQERLRQALEEARKPRKKEWYECSVM